MLGLWSQAGNALLVQQGQSGGRGPRQAPHCDEGQEPSWAQQERGGFFFRGANQSAFSQPAFSSSASHVIQTSALPLSWAPYWQIDTFAEMCSFCHSLWTDFFIKLPPPLTTHPFQTILWQIKSNHASPSLNHLVWQQSLLQKYAALFLLTIQTNFPFSCLKFFSIQLPI